MKTYDLANLTVIVMGAKALPWPCLGLWILAWYTILNERY